MIIRPARETDIPALIALWNPVIRDTTISFSDEEKTPESLAQMIEERRAAGREFFLAESGGLLGFATYAQFRGGNGYAHAMEHTIMLAPEARGRGAGRALMARIEEHARIGGANTLFAGVSGENPDGVAFHERMGFTHVARIPEAGRKFGRWLDLVLMMKFL
ncbi:GNAT family N-acetyltransferase [Defluviimonas sp. WL0024]|uniref:GNAT family N-acetyltransferase n=1 Tax=Albidovulum salinarum TaxID=2984153 RepID=A0ABT2X047_9RHOB|nr:GNAT family N-acetyltransferase [Defluviimonas sp. WL0024]MCU9847055.1 GNAT family N-acetyltransferase [Defluviimonas sp. WL0024]